MLPKQKQGQFVEILVLYLLRTLYMDLIQLNLQNEKSKYSSDKNALNFGGVHCTFLRKSYNKYAERGSYLIQFGDA
jgi:hypothetical protein